MTHRNALDLVGQSARKAVCTPDGKLENFTLKIAGQRHFCSCGCNVFHKPDDTNLDRYACNGCNAEFETE